MEANIETRPAHPVYGKAPGGHTQTVDGVVFYPYRKGVLSYVRVSRDGRIAIHDFGRLGSVYSCCVDNAWLPKKFRKFETAARAGIAAAGRPIQHTT